MASMNPALIPTRFLLLLGQLIFLITMFDGRKENVLRSLPYIYSEEEFYWKDVEMIVGLSLAIAFLALEFITFGSGLTMFSPSASLLSIIAHSLGSIFLVYFSVNGWCCSLFWWIFALTICLPLLCDFASIFSTFVFRS